MVKRQRGSAVYPQFEGIGMQDVRWTSALHGPEWNGDLPQQAKMRRVYTEHCLPSEIRNEREDRTIEEIMNLMNLGNKKVNKMLKELEEHGLIYRRHQGLGRPNKIYVYDLLKADNLNWLPKQITFGKGSSNEKEVL